MTKDEGEQMKPRRIAMCGYSTYRGILTVEIEDDQGNTYRMNWDELARIITGRVIVETRKARIYEHIVLTKEGPMVREVWSIRNDPLFDPADASAVLYQDAGGQNYLAVEHWNGRRHIFPIDAAEAGRIIATNNYRVVFWNHLADGDEGKK